MAITDATNPQTRSNDTPVTNTTPIIGDLDLSLDLPPVVKEASTPDTDWLKEEDKLVQNDTTNVSTIGNDATEGSPALAGEDLKTEAKDEVLQDNLPQSAKAMTLQDDMKIIQEIQNVELIKTQPQERILEAKKLDPSEVTAWNVERSTSDVGQTSINSPASQTINLDSLLWDTTPIAAPVQQIKSPFDLIQTNTPAEQVAQPAVTTAPVATPLATAKNKSVKIGLFVVLFVALGFLTYFIISTMYPMGFFANNATTGDVLTLATGDILTGDGTTGDILSGTEVVAADMSGSQDTGHGSATDSNFQDINSLMDDASWTTSNTTTLSQDAIVVKLNNYQQLGAQYLIASKAANDLEGIKDSLYLTKKAPMLLNEIIANPTAITTMQSDIATQITQMETFLQSLQTKYGDVSSTPTQTTGQTDQIPNSLTQE